MALYRAAMPIYKLYGGTPKIGLLNHHEGHTISDGSFEKIAVWFEVYLAQSRYGVVNQRLVVRDRKSRFEWLRAT